MMSKHVDIIAVAALLMGLAIYTHVRQAIVWKVMNQRRTIMIDRMLKIPAPPPIPSLVFR